MLGNVIKNLWKGETVPPTTAQAAPQAAPQAEAASSPQELLWAVPPKVAPCDSRLIVGFSGGSRSGVIQGIVRAWQVRFEKFGYRFCLVDAEQPDWDYQLLTAVREGVRCVVSPIGLGSTLAPDSDVCPWERCGIPFLKIQGDHPAYHPDRHRSLSRAHVSLYAFPDHRAYYERHLQGRNAAAAIVADVPLTGVMPPGGRPAVSRQRNGRLAFYKNGNDPAKLQRLWAERLPAAVVKLLGEASEELRSQMHLQCDVAWIDAVLERHLAARNLSPALPQDLRFFLTAQLDDYMRRAKSTLLGRVLAHYPVDVIGDFWEHVDFSQGPARWLGSGSYEQMLAGMSQYTALVDMTPNTSGATHERVAFATAHSTLCVANTIPMLTQRLPEMAAYGYDFSEDSVRHAVEKVLSDPERAVAAGFAAAESYERQFPEEQFVNKLIEMADLAHIRLTRPTVQEFCLWQEQEKRV